MKSKSTPACFLPDLATEGSSLWGTVVNEKGNLTQESQPIHFFSSPKERALSTDKWVAVQNHFVELFPQEKKKKNQSHPVSDLGTQISKEGGGGGIETGNIQKSEFYTASSQNIFSSQQETAFPNYPTWTLNQILLLLLPALLIERKDLFWSHMLKNACSYNEEFVCHAFCHISLLKLPALKMILENTTTSPLPFLSHRRPIWRFSATFLTPPDHQGGRERGSQSKCRREKGWRFTSLVPRA